MFRNVYISTLLVVSSFVLQACGGAVTPPSDDAETPDVPTIFELLEPASSPSSVQRPTLLVSGGGVKPGVSVEIYEKPDCKNLLISEEASSTLIEIQLPSLDDDDYEFSTRVTNEGLSSDCKGTVSYTVDTTDPAAPTVTSPTNGTHVGSSVMIVGTCESGTSITATGDVSPVPSAVSCDGDFQITVTLSVGSGAKNISLKSTDEANNVSAATVVSVIKDTDAPSVTINQAGGQADPTNNDVITFDIVFNEEIDPDTFTSADITNSGSATGVVFDDPITLDNISWTVTTNAVGADGTVIPTIAAGTVQDVAGNFNTISSSTDNSVTYDITPPSIAISLPSKSEINTGFITYDAVYTGASSINLTDSDVTVNTTGTVTYTTSVAHGTSHIPTITVRVTGGDGTITGISIDAATSSDLAGNDDLGASEDTDVTVDSTLVTVSIDAPSVEIINMGDVTYAVEYAGASSINLTDSDVNVTSSGVSYTVEVTDGTTSAPTITLHITGGDGTITGISIDAGTSDNGLGSFDTGTSQGTDIVVDNTPPTVAITTPMGGINSSNDSSYSFSGTCSENGTTITITAPAEVAGTSTICASGAFTLSTLDVSAITDGTVNFTVSIEDEATNTSTDTESAEKDSSPPVISALTLNSPSSPGNDTTPTIDVTGTFLAGDTFRLYTDMTCTTVASSVVAAVVDDTVTITTNTLFPDATYTFFAKGTDAVGNSVCESMQSVSYILDTSVPSITISTLSPINASNEGNYTVSGTCSANGDDIEITAPPSASGMTTTCILGTYSINGIDVSAEGEGAVNFTIAIEDVAGNTSSASSSANKDTVDPTITINALSLIGTTNENSYSISGTCSANGDTVSIQTPVLPGSTLCSGGIFTLSSINVSALAEGNVDFTLKIQDAAGNFVTEMASTTKDTTPPMEPSCDSVDDDATPTRSATATWTGSTDGETGIDHYEMSIGISAAADTVGWTDIGSVETPYQFTAISPKLTFNTDYTTYLRAVDGAGNVSDVNACSTWYLRNGYGNFTGTETTAGANPTYVNQDTSYVLKYSASSFNSNYFDHSTVTDSEQIIIKEPGNYLISHVLPVVRANGNSNSTSASVSSTIKINGTAKNIGFAANAYARGKTSGVSSPIYSSNHVTVLLQNLAINDVITIETKSNSSVFEPLKVPTGSNFTTYLEYIPDEANIFTATSTAVSNGTNLNQTTSKKFKWVESINDSGYTHSDGTSPENITFTSAGNYLLSVNLPYTGVKGNQKVEANIYINGSNLNQTSYMDSSTGFVPNNNGTLTTSTNYTNVLYNVPAGAVLDVRTIRLGNSSTVTVTSGKAASIYIQKLDTSSEYYVATGTSPSNWNTVAATNITWTTDHVKDDSLFTHSTSSSPQNITVDEAGDYIAYISDRVTAPTTPDYAHPMTRIKVNGTDYPGAECNGNTTRTTYTGMRTASCDLMILLPGLNASDVISYTTMADVITTGTVTGNPPRITLRKISN